MTMLYVILGLFAVAAFVGMYLISFVLRSKETPKGLVLLHGLFAATALVLLIFYTIKTGDLVQSLVLFTMAALGGFFLVFRDLTGHPVPKAIAVVHGLLAVSGFVFLLIYAFSRA